MQFAETHTNIIHELEASRIYLIRMLASVDARAVPHRFTLVT